MRFKQRCCTTATSPPTRSRAKAALAHAWIVTTHGVLSAERFALDLATAKESWSRDKSSHLLLQILSSEKLAAHAVTAGQSDAILLMSVTCTLTIHQTVALFIVTIFVCAAKFVDVPSALLSVIDEGWYACEDYYGENLGAYEKKCSAFLVPAVPTRNTGGSVVVLIIEPSCLHVCLLYFSIGPVVVSRLTLPLSSKMSFLQSGP